MSVKVSVVVPVYNPGGYIEPCIASLLRQTLPPDELELIFVDDGSTDQTPARLDQLAREHPHVKVIHQENSGWPGQPRNAGTDAATGEYVQYLDQDDELRDEALERLYAYARSNNSDVVIGRQVGVGRHVPVELFRRNRAHVTIHDSPIITSLKPHKMYRRAFLVEAGVRFPEGRRRLEDHVFVVATYFAARTISVLSDYVCYVHNARSDQGNAASEQFEPRDYYRNLREALDIVDANTEAGPMRDRLHRRWLRDMVSRLRGRGLLDRDETYQRKLFDEIRLVVLNRFTVNVDAGLQPLQRLVAALVRIGDFEAVRALAHWEADLQGVAQLTRARYHDGALKMAVSARLVDSANAAVAVRSTPTGRILAPPLPAALLGELDPGTLDIGDRAILLDIVIEHGATGVKSFLPRSGKRQEDDAAAASVRGRIEPGGETLGLAEGTWDVAVRLRAFGWTFTAPVTSSGADQAALPGPAVIGTPGRAFTLSWSESGQLRLDIGDETRSRRHSSGLQSLFSRLRAKQRT